MMTAYPKATGFETPTLPRSARRRAKRIRHNGLPFWLADRLLVGR
jgi:hypothetical protein